MVGVGFWVVACLGVVAAFWEEVGSCCWSRCAAAVGACVVVEASSLEGRVWLDPYQLLLLDLKAQQELDPLVDASLAVVASAHFLALVPLFLQEVPMADLFLHRFS